jgi:hypothetical protein
VDDVVGVAAPDPGDRVLIPQHRVHAPPIGPLENQPSKRVVVGLGAELGEWPVVPLAEDPPSGLALRPILLDEH